METHSSILTWTITRTEEPGGLQSTGCKEFHMTEVTLHAHMLLSHFCGRGGCGDIIQEMPNPGEDLTWFWSSMEEVNGWAAMVVMEVGGGEAAIP